MFVLLMVASAFSAADSETSPAQARARFVAEDADDVLEVEVIQGAFSQRCTTQALNPQSCEIVLEPGTARVVITGTSRFTFTFDHPPGLTVHRLKYRSRWPLYVGAGLAAAGIAAIGLGVSYALQCENGTIAQRAVACGGTANVGYVLGGTLLSAGIAGMVWGFLGTGDLSRSRTASTAVSPVALLPRLMLAPAAGGAYAQAGWTF